jgi:hypothetical protein
MITCRRCEESQPEDNFAETPAGNKRKICKSCEYKRRLERKNADPDAWAIQKLGIQRKHKYGVTPEQVWAMLKEQNYTCAICPNEITYKSAHLDHCHTTLKVRGLLCKLCNYGLGSFRDNIEYLQAAIAYLER